MANIKISALPSVQPSGYTNQDLLVIVNYDVSSGTTKNTPLSGLTSYVLSGLTFPTDYLPLSGGTVTGDTIFNQGLTATTISAATYLGLPLDVYVTGGTYSAGTITFTNNSGGTFPVSGITSNAGNQWLIPTGDTVTVNSNYQYFIYGDIIVQGTLILETNSQLVVINGDVINSGGTITNNGTISDIEIPLFDTQVTGGTYSAGTITFTNNSGGTFTVTGLTTSFTGNTSGDCIIDLFVSNVNSCSPLHIQPTNNGDVLIGENGGVNVGIGTLSPTAKLHINNTTSGNTFLVEDDTNPDSTPFLIDYLGNVGIGTNTPSVKLEVNNGNIKTNQAVIVDGSTPYGIRFNDNGFSRIVVGGGGSLKFDAYFIEGFAFNGATYQFFNYDQAGLTGDSFQIANSFIKGKIPGTIDTAKYFAINVTGTPTSMLHVVGSDSSSGFGLKVQDSGGTDNLVVRNDGNVGIGTNSPNANLDIFYGNTFTSPKNLLRVRQYDSNREVFKIYDFGGSGGSQITSEYATWGFGMPADAPTANRLSIKGNTSNSSTASIIVQDNLSNYIFILRDDGKVGIGTVSPSETLDVSGKTKTINFQMTSGATTSGYVLTNSDGSGNAQWQPASGITGVGNVFKYTTTTAFTASVTQTITHNLNTKFVHCSVWDTSTDQLVTAQVVRTIGNQTNAVDITISTSGTYDILITG